MITWELHLLKTPYKWLLTISHLIIKISFYHLDRGIQYCCPEFTEFASQNNFRLSTTQQYDPYENAVAERINGIFKHEFGLKKTIKSVQIARQIMSQAAKIYN